MENKESLISIIVPVYNMQDYLTQCLDSLLAQTYKNLQIILVDDGSTDSSGKMCDDYAKKDARINVLHKQNAGLPAARKTGLEYAKGDYIGFVDSDDWVDKDFFSYLYNLIKKYKTDIAVCGPYGQYSKYLFMHPFKPFVLQTQQALCVSFNDKFFGGYVWNKLYKKSLWDNIQIPTFTMFEDLFFTSQILPKTDKIVFSCKRKYHYRYRNTSISKDTFNNNKLNYYYVVEAMLDKAKSNNWHTLHQQLIVLIFVATTRNKIHLLLGKTKDAKLKDIIQNKFKKYAKECFAFNSFLPKRLWFLFITCLNLLISDFFTFFTKLRNK
jgi:glycosyltransferase involved in cell wall biosynthesis